MNLTLDVDAGELEAICLAQSMSDSHCLHRFRKPPWREVKFPVEAEFKCHMQKAARHTHLESVVFQGESNL
jgi:hypothetical protein